MYIFQCDRPGWFVSMLADGMTGIYQYMYIFQCDRPGWFVGMLADGTTGIYPADHLKPSPVSAQSEA